MNYYYVLDLDEDASLDEIKKSFRKKLKAHHPDVNDVSQSGAGHQDNLLNIINAYNVLSNPVKRRQYDSQLVFHFSKPTKEGGHSSRKSKIFDYEKFLLARQDIWKYRVKLLIYDIIYCKGDRAVGIYESMLRDKAITKLQKTLGRYDYIDYMVLIAEYYQEVATIESSQKALKIYNELGDMESEVPYFKSYMEEIADRILTIIDRFYKKLDLSLVVNLSKAMLRWPIVKKQKKKLTKLL